MLRMLFPKGKTEVIIFLSFFIIYGALATFMALGTSIAFGKEIPSHDAYFSFDNQRIAHYGHDNMEGHPLLYLFTRPLLYIGIILNYIFSTIKAKSLFFALCTTFFVTSSLLYVYRYLCQVIELRGYQVYLLLILYSFTSTAIVLSFTFETFTFSLCILSFILYYYTYQIKQNQSVSLSLSAIFALVAGGVTITNFGKGLIPILFLNKNRITIVKRIVIISVVFAALLLVSEYYFHIFSAIQYRLGRFVIYEGEIYKYIIDWFLGAPILLPSLVVQPFPLYPDFHAINIDYYRYWWQYCVIGSIFFLLILSVIKNHKNKLMYMVFLFFLIDITLHIIVKYGINEGFIYGGHWVFVVPIFIGWLFKQLNERQSRFLFVYLTVITIVVAINNVYQMNHFINLARQLFPV